jgi:hypothetical protein
MWFMPPFMLLKPGHAIDEVAALYKQVQSDFTKRSFPTMENGRVQILSPCKDLTTRSSRD